MKITRTIYAIFNILIFTLLFSCIYSTKLVSNKELSQDKFIIWAFSDIQPKFPYQYEEFENVAEEMSEIIPRPDMAISAGDIVQGQDYIQAAEDYDWFFKNLKKTGINPVYFIAGNHDARNLETYRKHVKQPYYYTISYGNLLIIMMSNTENDHRTMIRDSVFQWWQNLVIKNQDKIIITMTHASLKWTGFPDSFITSWNVSNSRRFLYVLMKYHVDLWLFGHTHTPSYMGQNMKQIPQLNNTQFINIAGIREDTWLADSESRFLIFKPGSDILDIKLRNHRKRLFNNLHEIKLKLRSPFVPGDKIKITEF